MKATSFVCLKESWRNCAASFSPIAESEIDTVMTTRLSKKFIRRLRYVGSVISKWPEIRVIKEDPADDMILACALAAGAEYIVSKDAHLKDLGDYQGIKLVSTDEFLQLLKRES